MDKLQEKREEGLEISKNIVNLQERELVKQTTLLKKMLMGVMNPNKIKGALEALEALYCQYEEWDDIAVIHCIGLSRRDGDITIKKKINLYITRKEYYEYKELYDMTFLDVIRFAVRVEKNEKGVETEEGLYVPCKFKKVLAPLLANRAKVEFTIGVYPTNNKLIYSLAVTNAGDNDNFDKYIGRNLAKSRIIAYLHEEFNMLFYKPELISIREVKE